MASKKKLLQAAAGAAAGAGLDIDEAFSTYLYDGTGSAQTITNGIDLAGEGGLVWTKSRSAARNHSLHDSARGVTCLLKSNATNAQYCDATQMASFNSNGFTVGSDGSSNTNGDEYVSWTFRKAPKFFDVVTYTGNGTAGRTVSHNLGTTVGMFIVKEYGASGENWSVYHRGLGATKTISLNRTNAASTSSNHWNDTAPTSTEFTLGDEAGVNGNGKSFVAYLFAHNNSDGEFGPDSDQDVIKCGSYTGTGAKLDINLGFEAQWVMVKRTDTSGYDWHMFDVMRGMPVGTDAFWLEANTSNSEAQNAYMSAHPTGFTLPAGHPEVCASGGTYIYMAIRRGPLAEPTSATDVFHAVNGGPDHNSVPFPTDFVATTLQGGADNFITARIQGNKYTKLNDNDPYSDFNNFKAMWADMTGTDFGTAGWWASSSSDTVGWHWKRAPGFCDVVVYEGTGSAQNINHNLGVAPEMMWIKSYATGGYDWMVYHKDLSPSNALMLKINESGTGVNRAAFLDSTDPSSTVFRVGTDPLTNNSGTTFIAKLFGTVAGVSKIGTIVGNGSTSGDSQTIDCGFSNGARFVLIKRVSASGGWYIWDSQRGIVAGNDPFLILNNANAEQTSVDALDPHSSGFIVNYDLGWNLNKSGETSIFYAIA